MTEVNWYVLGFTYDDIVIAWQDSRLAQACIAAERANRARGKLAVLQSPGAGDHMIHWFISLESARVLDAQRVNWRQFLLSTCAKPPDNACEALTR